MYIILPDRVVPTVVFARQKVKYSLVLHSVSFAIRRTVLSCLHKWQIWLHMRQIKSPFHPLLVYIDSARTYFGGTCTYIHTYKVDPRFPSPARFPSCARCINCLLWNTFACWVGSVWRDPRAAYSLADRDLTSVLYAVLAQYTCIIRTANTQDLRYAVL